MTPTSKKKKTTTRKTPKSGGKSGAGARSSARRERAPKAGAREARAATGDAAARLGAKHVCFACGAKFYDLNKPEPICPKCGADQRNRPKRDLKGKGSPGVLPRPARPIAPLLDEEEDEVVVDDDDIDLDLEVVDGADFGDQEDVDEVEEEDEEPGR